MNSDKDYYKTPKMGFYAYETVGLRSLEPLVYQVDNARCPSCSGNKFFPQTVEEQQKYLCYGCRKSLSVNDLVILDL